MYQLLWSTLFKKAAVVFTVVVSAAVLAAIVWQWGWLSGGEFGNTPNETLRNLGLVIAGVIAFPIAIWRAVVADRQSRAAQEQANSANEHSETAQQGLLYDRYQRGASMLGDEKLAVRLAGIYALQRLAGEDREQYDEQIMRLFCAFIRNHSEDEKVYRERLINRPPIDAITAEDVKATLAALRDRCRIGEGVLSPLSFTIDFSGAVLGGCNLSNMDLSKANLYRAKLDFCNLSHSVFNSSNLDGSSLCGADLSGSIFSGVKTWSTDFSKVSGMQPDFSDANLMGANFSDAKWERPILRRAWITNCEFTNAPLESADLSGAFFITAPTERSAITSRLGITQKQLDEAYWDFETPPTLYGLLDAETQQPLVLNRHKPD